MKRRWLHRLLLAVPVVLVLVWVREDLKVAFGLLRDRLTLATALGIALFTLLHFVNEPIRWWVLLRKDYPRTTLSQTYHTLTVTALASYLFPARLGMPLRVFMAKRVLDLEYATASALLFLDSLLTYGIWSATAIAGVLVLFPGSRLIAPAAGVLLVVVGVTGLLLVAGRRWPAQGLGLPARFAAGLRLLSTRAALGNALLLAADVLAFGIRHTLILAGLGTHGAVWSVTLAVAISIVAGFASLMPLGLGAYDLSLAFLLTTLGVPREAAVAVPIINRISTISIGTLLGAVSAAHLGLKPSTELAATESPATWLSSAEIEEP